MKSIKELNFVSTNPNFTIVLPTGCNANCSFCSWRTSNQHKQHFNTEKFLEELTITLEKLPKKFTQITISGGEPSTYKDLYKVMNIIAYHKRKNINKVVFTTNGTNLLNISKEEWFTDVVDFVNISRHDFNQEKNDSIFGIKTIDWATIRKISNILGNEGIPVNINAVMSSKINTVYDNKFIKDFVKAAHKNYVNTITFRKDYDDGFGVHESETTMGKAKDVGECPVCRKSKYILNGMEVLFTTSEFEPDQMMYSDKDAYELILQPNATVSTDWAGKNTVDMLDSVAAIKRGRPEPKRVEVVETPYYGCGYSYGGCGS